MNRENRYLVLKHTDITAGLSMAQRKILESLADMVADRRSIEGKHMLQAVVIESDWPEYEPVWRMLARRVEPWAPPTPEQKAGAMALLQHHATITAYLKGKGVFEVSLSQGNYLLNVAGNCPKSGALLNKTDLQRFIDELQVLCDAMSPANQKRAHA